MHEKLHHTTLLLRMIKSNPTFSSPSRSSAYLSPSLFLLYLYTIHTPPLYPRQPFTRARAQCTSPSLSPGKQCQPRESYTSCIPTPLSFTILMCVTASSSFRARSRRDINLAPRARERERAIERVERGREVFFGHVARVVLAGY